MTYNLPGNNVAEVTLIGTGGGYGESCVVHYGNGRWAVIDSCINPSNNQCLPLKYLIDIGIDVSTQVDLIICTHWHNDHILGLSQLLAEAKCADFCFGNAIDKKKFLYMVSLDYQKLKDNTPITSTNEFVECLKIMRTRSTKVIAVGPDRTIKSNHQLCTSIISLSPSDETIKEFNQEISELITEFGAPSKKYTLLGPNDKSVVILLSLGSHRALLGADLEVTSDRRKGWYSIIDSSQHIAIKSSLFKIPHHGSQNGYCEEIWVNLLEKTPIGKLTPWNRNNALPQPEMVVKYVGKTNGLYLTSAPANKLTKAKPRSKSVEKTIKLFNKKVSEIKYQHGLIRSRIQIDDPNSKWSIELDGEGFQIPS